MRYINLEVDIRNAGLKTREFDEFHEMWSFIETRLHGRRLPQDGSEILEAIPGRSDCYIRLKPLGRGSIGKVIDKGSRLSLSRIVESPITTSPCRMCQDSGIERVGEYACSQCRSAGSDATYCNTHINVLDGALGFDGQFNSSCLVHPAKCKHCDLDASFFCHGPLCKGKDSSCSMHGRYLPGTDSGKFCFSCLETIHPQCEVPGCHEPAFATCEHVDSHSDKVCGGRFCNRHMARWQIFGPNQLGLAYCRDHRVILKNTTLEQITFLTVAGTALRKIREKNNSSESGRTTLPSLAGMKYILLKYRDKFASEEIAFSLYDELRRQLSIQQQTEIRKKMWKCLDERRVSWNEGRKRASDRKQNGKIYFDQLINHLRVGVLSDFVDQIEYTDFYPATDATENFQAREARLLVRVPEELRGHFIGYKGRHISMLKDKIGCKIMLEKDE